MRKATRNCFDRLAGNLAPSGNFPNAISVPQSPISVFCAFISLFAREGMAAVRAGAVGLTRAPRYTVFSSRGGDWSEREERERNATPSTGKRYGVAMSNAETARSRWKLRRKLSELKVKLCDCTLVLALAGLIFSMIDVEICATGLTSKYLLAETGSHALRLLTIGLTVILLLLLVVYHIVDIRIHLVETGNLGWRVGITKERVARVLIELAVCSVCPLPETGVIRWPQLSNVPEKTRTLVPIPVNVLFTIPMFLRLYIGCRYVVLHSSQYQDCATRTIASLNHIAVDLRFVVKSEMYRRPLYMLTLASVSFWCVMSWMLTQCERYAFPTISGFQHFADYLWFEIITFFSIGYGDVQVQTYCGRALAMLTAVVGTLFSSTLIALMSRKLILSSSERRVNHVIAENFFTKEHKHAAARVLQNTWRAVLRSRECAKAKPNSRPNLKLASAQRALLASVNSFRKSRWRLRMQMEDEDDFFTARRAFTETEERLQKVRLRQSQLDGKLSKLFENVEALTRTVVLPKYY
ncbi:unnamed protein product [Caenorhabditis auriculariae]|uniref:Calmodulin-binding domain-containing protein n=1 Tax=Caenorhabditis auriculariae TaxID=2777116 RepID=A0A8S1HRG4_9PELO|nr:unnamed protein product [Caenorhabditis auriculariae]